MRGESTFGDSSTGEESKLWRSRWGSHLSDLGHRKIEPTAKNRFDGVLGAFGMICDGIDVIGGRFDH